MKSNGLVCPFNQISVSTLKLSPVLRTTLHRIIWHCWSHQKVPKFWKLGFTILIYKKDGPENPAKFRPITLEPICARMFTSLIRNRTYTFLVENNYVETKIKIGFLSGVLVTVGHIETLPYLHD